ncbi:sensor histidine kinase [Actinopolymorpha pittospori]
MASLVGGLIYTDPVSGAANSALAAVVTVGLMLGAWAWRAARRLQREELVRGWELARALKAERGSALAAAVAKERSVLAGEVHDRLGHRLNLATVRLGGLWLDRELTARQREAIEEVRAELAEITDEVGATVRLLAGGSPAPEHESDPDSVVARARAAGCVVDADLAAVVEVNGLARNALGRVLEEALGNAARHATGAPVYVLAQRDSDRILLTVSNPLTATAPDPGAGTGLRRLRDRVERLGGTMEVRRDTRFEIEVEVPVNAWLHPATDDDS